MIGLNSFKIVKALAAATITVGLWGCGNSGRNNQEEDPVVSKADSYNNTGLKEIEVVEEYNESMAETFDAPKSAQERYRTKYEEVHNADIHLMRADGRRIWYNPWIPDNDYGYMNKLFVYNSESDTETVVNLNRTSMEDDEMYVEDMVERNGIITIIMSEKRNSNGWVEGTYLWQYNCNNGTWMALARACSGAEFVNNRSAIRINNAEILNPDDPTYLQEYRNHYRTVRL